MQQHMKKIISESIVSIAVVVASFFAWQSVERALTVSGASDWFAPMLWFFALCAALSLFCVMVRKNLIALLVLALSLLPSIFFVPHPIHVAAVVLAFLLLFLAYGRVQNDVRLSIVIRVLQSVRIGMRMATIALVLVLTSHYFWTVRTLPAETVLPTIKSAALTSVAVEGALRVMDPSLRDVDAEQMTVDGFLATIQKSSAMDDISMKMPSYQVSRDDVRNISPEEAAMLSQLEQDLHMAREGDVTTLQPLLIAQARENLAVALGRDLSGTEKIADVFAEYLKAKTLSAVGATERQPLSLPVSVTLSLLLFITALSLGAFVRAAGETVAAILFAILRRVGIVVVVTVQKPVEVLE